MLLAKLLPQAAPGCSCERIELHDVAKVHDSAAEPAGRPPAGADVCMHTLRLDRPSLPSLQAASRLERGRATCLRCQGSGTANCPSCKVGTARMHWLATSF